MANDCVPILINTSPVSHRTPNAEPLRSHHARVGDSVPDAPTHSSPPDHPARVRGAPVFG